MKHFALLISILSITFSCANTKTTNKKPTTNYIQTEEKKPVQDYSKISPGTCILLLNNTKIHSLNGNYFLSGVIQKINGYGAGFTSVFEVNQELKLKISSKKAQSIEEGKELICTIREEMKMGQSHPSFRLIQTATN